MNKSIIVIVLSTLMISCVQTSAYRLGHFTAASSFNIRNLRYDSNSAVRVMGEDCYKVGEKPNDSRLQRAMDNAIRNGQVKGIIGDLLVNVRIDQVEKNKPGFLGIPTRHNCIEVEGDLVTLH